MDGVGPRALKHGDLVFAEGEPSNGVMYFIFSGELGVTKNVGGVMEDIRTMKDGEFFGEMALIQNKPRTATVRVKSPIAKLGLIDRRAFGLLGRSKPAFLVALLRTVAARIQTAEERLAGMQSDAEPAPRLATSTFRLLDYKSYMGIMMLKKGDVVFSSGELGRGKMYALLFGECLVSHVRNSRMVSKQHVSEGGFFGEMGILSKGRRTSTATIESPSAKVGVIDTAAFTSIGSHDPEFFFALLKASVERLIDLEDAIKRAVAGKPTA